MTDIEIKTLISACKMRNIKYEIINSKLVINDLKFDTFSAMEAYIFGKPVIEEIEEF